MSLTLKLASLAIRTLAKPVGNSIKSRAREHDTFRRVFIRFAQGLHRVDMRMRLGILHDSAAQERMHAREAAEQAAAAAKRKLEAETPTVRTAEEQAKFEEESQKIDEAEAKEKPAKAKPKIRPLTDARAIELGANFASEAFIFMVAAGLLVFERWWSRRKDAAKDEHVVERLTALEEQTERVGYLEREIRRLRGENVPEPPPRVKEGDPTVAKEGEKQSQVVVAATS